MDCVLYVCELDIGFIFMIYFYVFKFCLFFEGYGCKCCDCDLISWVKCIIFRKEVICVLGMDCCGKFLLEVMIFNNELIMLCDKGCIYLFKCSDDNV